ncbi:MAG: hypothetical protein AAF441_08660 [Pseudomonadota bacterium]
MAETPQSTLEFFLEGCPSCGERQIALPEPLPEVGDDFAWRARDFDAIRQFMLEELAARFPERSRWTPADMEVVIVEVLAAVLDQLSDMVDRVAQEGFLESARHPRSVRRLLSFIGYDAALLTRASGVLDDRLGEDPSPAEVDDALERYWLENPTAMDAARRLGPETIFEQNRMVTLADYAARLDDHPMVLRAKATSSWTGSWQTIHTAVILHDTAWRLDQSLPEFPAASKEETQIKALRARVELFHKERGLPVPLWDRKPAIRSVLRRYLDAYRMAGQQVLLVDAVPVGIAIIVSIIVRPNYFQAEVRQEAVRVLGKEEGGFFTPGRLSFGEDLFAGDLIAMLMDISGVENVCLIRFKRIGSAYPDQADTGHIALEGNEIAVSDNIPGDLGRGYSQVRLHGGRTG